MSSPAGSRAPGDGRARGRGRIPDRDIAAIRERVRIDEVVGDYVQLRRAGADSLKGLCPFHDEKSPSFHVRPNHGHFHCFGCGEGGDVYAFLQKIEHVSFVEAVELLADRIGHTITYSGPATSVQRDRGSRSRLIAANAAAAEFYAAALESDEAAPARQYLTERNFDAEAARHFGCGFAPSGWDTLTKHLQRKGFEFKELEAAGLSRQGRRGPMDRFHRRLLWPIRSSAGEVIGFGARRLFDDDPMEAKYINTPETLLYKKSNVMFGIDLAKRDIAKGHQAVVVEGYTDVMAMHLAGVTTAVASCGTAFGDEHLAMLRRLMMDDSFFRGELIYVFDGDAAGRAAALKAFGGEQNLAGQSFVAVAPDGMDPCDLRLRSGDAALRDLVARRTPLFEFAIRSALAELDLDSAEGRVAALRRCVPMVAQIKDPTLRDEYARQLAGWVGWSDVAQVIDRVRSQSKHSAGAGRGGSGGRVSRRAEQSAAPAGPAASRPDPRDPTLWPQREALKSALQYPALAGPVFDSLTVESFTHPGYAAVRAAIEAAGGTSSGVTGGQWIEAVRDRASSPLTAGLISELGVEAIQVDDEKLPRYIAGVLARLQEVWMGRQIAEVKSKLQRMSPIEQGDEYHALFGDLVAMEAYRRSLLEQASGDD
ncbi:MULTISPECIES: DNA primase [Mycobacterium avium complex (MAC)]|uniref:DNA primase n=10 Tax=Mycobacterium avium complex (MAC) TaxID=120793 RepID=A0A2A3LAP0_MYCAV|nr:MULTISPECIES: DNA primase [Mycobacterium avium complex (MAC)]ETA93072.1 DNA primase [Mycobacterium avium 05-4293]TXA43189.1 DNA primase [Mycobacterium tuberculosis variant bovis]ABK69370.1 DNA primase [Mycobacterium avium 104]APT11280.1 DNA primase [Mycobacterium avium subsp. hominissuis]AXO23922.1 DNA primase [Mycobacterium avium subsp. hominissuis]